MKKIRFLIIYILFSLFASIGFGSLAHADFSGFIDQLRTMNIPINQILIETGITRYEVTRLLNAVECKDCINPDRSYIDRYTPNYWTTFLGTMGNYFKDIKYNEAKFNKKSYYNCVAYVGDNDYMNGYPTQTSPLCAGQFCGLRYITKAEFLQVIINMISKYLYPVYALNWSEARNWLLDLNADSYEWKTFTSNEIATIKSRAKDCGSQSCPLQNANELKLYLKYCMFNLDACSMVPFGKIKEGYWPVAELNLLYRQQMINVNDAEKYSIGQIIDGKLVIEVLSKMNEIIGCAFNNDYDCDGITNSQDSCPYTYNPHQKDTDGDGIGDSCDDDIDGDGVKNPIGIVDDNGRINVGLWTGTMDNCLYVINSDQAHTKGRIGDACLDGLNNLSLTIAIQEMGGILPKTVSFAALSKGPVQSLSWDFGDGNFASGQSVIHSYIKPGLYTVRLIAKGNSSNDAFAKTTVIVGRDSREKNAISPLVDALGGNVNSDISINLSLLGTYDRFEWDFGDGTTATSTKDSLKKVFRQAGTFPVSVKAITNGTIGSAGIFWVGIGTGGRGSLLKSSTLSPDKNTTINFDTSIYGFNQRDIAVIQWNFGDGTTSETNTLTTKHQYKQSGKKAVLQTIVLKNGTKLSNLITIYVSAPHLFDSYGMQFLPSSLENSTFKRLSFTTDILAESLSDYVFLGDTYDDGKSDIVTSTQKVSFPFSKYHVYITPGVYYPQTNLTIDQCTWLSAQATLAVNGNDACLQAMLDGTLSKYTCDIDKDGIPDICDTDMDGDGKTNLLGIINPGQYNNCNYIGALKDASNNNGNTNKNLLNMNILDKHFMGVCSLDNAVFVANPDQQDTDKNNIGDALDNALSGNHISSDDILTEKDSDSDGIPDVRDICPYLSENYNGVKDTDGCPEIGAELNCENNLFPAIPGFTGIYGGTNGGTSGGTGTNGETGGGTGTNGGTGGGTGTNGETGGGTGTNGGTGGGTGTNGEIGTIIPGSGSIFCKEGQTDCLIIIPQACIQCPCPYSDFSSALTNNDQVKAVLRDSKKKYPRGYSIAFPISYSN